MDHFEDIPPDLAETDARLRANRPSADAPTLDRVLARAQRVRGRRLTSLLPSPAASSRSRVAVVLATLIAVVGSTGVATAVMGVSPRDALRAATPDLTSSDTSSGASSGAQLQRNAGNSQYCPPLAELEKERAELEKELADERAKPKPDRKKIRQLERRLEHVNDEIERCYG